MPSVTVFSKPACVQCRATIKRLDQKGIAYTYLDVTEDEAAYQQAASYGITQMPIVVAGEKVWGGYKPESIDAL